MQSLFDPPTTVAACDICGAERPEIDILPWLIRGTDNLVHACPDCDAAAEAMQNTTAKQVAA